jgi:nitronate monooxygenase
MGTRAGSLEKRLLKGGRTRAWMRTFYALRSIWQLKRASLDETGSFEYWQAGRSVAGVNGIEPAGEIVRRFATALREERPPGD